MRTSTAISKTTRVIPSTKNVPEAPKAMPKATERMLIDAMTDAHMLHRDALEIELAIGLSLFGLKADADKATLQAKKELRAIYEKAGYDCKDASGADYKTCMRRIGATADLYAHIGGRETLIDWLEDAPAKEQINKIVEHLKQYRFSGISDVQAQVGKGPQKRERLGKPAAEKTQASNKSADNGELAAMVEAKINVRREAEAKGIPEGRVISSGPLTVAIPFEATYDEVMGLARNLMQFANQQMQLPVAKEQQQQAVTH